MKYVWERIKDLRQSQHLSQEYVAKYLEMSRATYTQMENGNRKVTADDLAKLSELFSVSADSILKDDKVELPANMFARSFEKLSETDQAEIMNLIRFKEQMKRNMEKQPMGFIKNNGSIEKKSHLNLDFSFYRRYYQCVYYNMLKGEEIC